jgi:hypothetical protein
VSVVSHIASVVFVMVLPMHIWAASALVFTPVSIQFDSVGVGQQDSTVLTIKNTGRERLSVLGGKLALKDASAFSVKIDTLQLNVGDSVQVIVRFEPIAGGEQADVLTVEARALSQASVERFLVQLAGKAVGAEIDVSPSVLSFASSGLGVSVTQNISVKNWGNDSLRVARIFAQDVRFVVDANTFVVGPNKERVVKVTYTPDSIQAQHDTLCIVSNDFDEDTLKVVLDAQATPQQVGVARVSLVKNGATFPQVGDTVSVAMTLVPNGASIAGVELFFGYDPVYFTVANTGAPFVLTGYSESQLKVLSNAIVSQTNALVVTHLSGLGAASDSITTNGLLTQIDLIVKAPLIEATRLRVLVESPLFNSQFITPSGLAFTMPGSNSVGLGNTPPTLRPFPPLKMSEDVAATLGLRSLASDAESGPNELQWSFHDPDSLILVSISTPDTALGYIARFFPPENLSGTFTVMAKVSDPAGAADSSVLVVDVTAVNDQPSIPAEIRPGNEATGVSSPVTLQWRASDPDVEDVLVYDVSFGLNELFLELVAEGISDSAYTIETNLLVDTNYYWQVVARDLAGEERSGPIWTFTTESDLVAPIFLGGPEIVEVSDSTASVFWSVDEPVSARIVLGVSANLSDSLAFDPVVVDAQSRLRTQEIDGLTPGTQYYLQITLRDAAGNPLVSDILGVMTTGENVVVPVIRDMGDFTGDRLVNFEDFVIFAAVFNRPIGSIEYIPNADFNSNGVINFEDFVVFAGVFGNNYATGKPTN